MRLSRRHWLIGALVVGAALAGLLSHRFEHAQAQEAEIEISAGKILNFRLGGTETHFGALQFVGGLQLTSKARDFGGLSGMRLGPEGRLLAITDKCRFLSAQLARDVIGAPLELREARLGPLPPAANGRPLGRRGYTDCEAMEWQGDTVWISFEGNGAIGRFTLGPEYRLGKFEDVTPPGRKIRYSRNAGLEAIARFPEGSPLAGELLAIAEETLDRDGNHIAWFGDGRGRTEFAIRRSDDFAITDADFLPDGRLVTLERRFGLRVGPAFRIRRFDLAGLGAGTVLDGETLIMADLAYRIDNMEGLDAWQDGQGRTRLTLLSDDNFNFLQSTILLEFLLNE